MNKSRNNNGHCMQYAMVNTCLIYDTSDMTDAEIKNAVRNKKSLASGRVERFDRCPECEEWTKENGQIRVNVDCPAVQKIADERKLLDARRLQATPIPNLKQKTRPVEAYVDRQRGWVVQVYDDTDTCNGTPWEGALRVGVCHRDAKTLEEFNSRDSGIPITWDELQAIKDCFWKNQIALEVYPPNSKKVDAANMRWLWVLPPGSILPFNLQSPIDLLTSDW